MDSTVTPTYVLVPGVLHTPAHFQGLSDALHAKSYHTEHISHPTVGALAATAPPTADVGNLRRVLEELINNQQKEVVPVCHSYGGIPGCQSIVGLEHSTRAKADQKGGIVKVIFLTAIVPREGENLRDTFAGAGILSSGWLEINVGRPYVFPKCADFLCDPLAARYRAHYDSQLQGTHDHISRPA